MRLAELEVALPGLVPEFAGLRIAHLSDFHFGVPSPGIGAAWQAAVWARQRKPDLVAITGDLLTHPRGEPMLRRLVRVGTPAYERDIEVKHFLWMIAEGEGYDQLKQVAHKGLKGLKIAPFYGCQILRPSKIMGFEDPDRPWSLERIIEACGGEAIDYPAKIKCCGFPIIQAREETALGELIQPIEQAMEAGADCMVTPCPLCHLSLDAWQQKLEKATGRTFGMPILHLSQLVGVAAGLEESELRFKRHVVSVEPVVEKLQA